VGADGRWRCREEGSNKLDDLLGTVRPAGRDLDARPPAWAGLNRHDGRIDDLAARRCPQVLGAAVGKRRVVGQERRQHVAGAPTKVL
jgi:hypothetical protein